MLMYTRTSCQVLPRVWTDCVGDAVYIGDSGMRIGEVRSVPLPLRAMQCPRCVQCMRSVCGRTGRCAPVQVCFYVPYMYMYVFVYVAGVGAGAGIVVWVGS